MTAETIHTCSYECERPGCIRAQRDELRDRLEALTAAQQQPAAPNEEAAAFDTNFLRHIASVCRAAYDLCQPKPQRTPEDDREYNGGLCLSELANIADEIEQRLAASNRKAVDGCHCGTCTCNPNMTPAVRFDLSPAQTEGAIRDHLIRLGWTPPDERAMSQQPEARGGGEAEPPNAPVGVDAPGSRAWMAEVCRAAALSLAAHGVRNDQLSKVADWIAQQTAAVDEGFVSRLAEALTDQDWDVDPDGDGSGIAQLRAAVVAAQHQEPKS